MTISIEACASIVQLYNNKNKKSSDILREIKDLFHHYNRGAICPVSNQDINFIEIIEYFDLTEREKDIIFIFNFFHSCYIDYNITHLVMKEKLTPVGADRLLKMYDILSKYNLLHLLIKKEIDRDSFIMELNNDHTKR